MWCAATGAHAPLDRLPNEWTLRRAARTGRRAASARIVAVNVGHLVLRTENGDLLDSATSVDHPERSVVCLWLSVITVRRRTGVKAARITDFCIPHEPPRPDRECRGYFIECRAAWIRPAGSPIAGGVDAPSGHMSEISIVPRGCVVPYWQAPRRASFLQAAPPQQPAWPRTRAAGAHDARR